MKTALVHDWLTLDGGAEHVLRAMRELFPSPIYTLFAKKGWSDVHTSFLQRLPFKAAFPLYPLAIESFDLSAYDVILSSSHSVAKGVITREDQTHICYCHTPPRYLWDLHTEYKTPLLAKPFLHRWRMWDVLCANRVDHFIANSKTVANRIKKTYRRDAKVIYPPVRTDFFTPGGVREEYYVTAGRLVPYKQVKLMVEAFSHMPKKRLIVIGDGPEYKKLKRLPNITYTGRVSDEILRSYLQRAQAFLFFAHEDFGIAPVEAMACGTPVIAYARGGALETVHESCGHFLFDRSLDAVIATIEAFEKRSFDHAFIADHAKQFSVSRFKEELKREVLTASF